MNAESEMQAASRDPLSKPNGHMLSVSLKSEGNPTAVLPMRLNQDALSDLVIRMAGSAYPSIAVTPSVRTFTVTTTVDDLHSGSLRAAILDANRTPGADKIIFDIPGTSVPTIQIITRLPSITDALTIDGTSQPNSGRVEIQSLLTFGDRLDVIGGNTTIRGLVLNWFYINLQLKGNNIVEGNLIGMDLNGVPRNNFVAVHIERTSNNKIGGTVTSARNVIVRPAFQILGGGFVVGGGQSEASGNIVLGNFIGTDAIGSRGLGSGSGIRLFGATNTTLGGVLAGSRNVILGGIDFDEEVTGTLVQGNFIGTDAAGMSNPGGGFDDGVGVDIATAENNTVGGTSPNARNVISGNRWGVVIRGFLNVQAKDNLVQGNFIGTDVTGTGSLSNGQDGVFVDALAIANTIGGTVSGARNIIAFNKGNGVRIPNATGSDLPGLRIAILGNAIFANGALGIDLGGPGVTPNDDRDSDFGANELQNFPVLTSADTLAGTKTALVHAAAATTITGTLNSIPNTTLTLQFFFGADCQGSGHQFVGAIPIPLQPTIEVRTDTSGNAPFTFSFAIPTGSGSGWVNCTATNATGNTSEFSECIAVTSSNAPNITAGAFREGKHLIVVGENFDSGAKVMVNNGDRKTIFESTTRLKGKKLYKQLTAGQTVTIHVRNSDGLTSNAVSYTKPSG